ncbi:sensor histidine kinase [Lutibacter sp. B2]|nr:sensor histidine kinase [Lutibacter sp. B2]
MLSLFKALLNHLGYVIIIAFLISRFSIFREIVQKGKIKRINLFILALFFGSLGILGTYIGINVKGAIANTRNIGVMVGGILCGPVVGIAGAALAAIHRILIDTNGITAFPCAMATLIGGYLSGKIYIKSTMKNRWLYGLLGGIIVENISMSFILIFSKPFYLAFDIVKSIYIPMVLVNGVGISIAIMITENIFEAEEEIAAKQAKQVLEIANKTLPHFRKMNKDSLNEACKVIKDSIHADAVAITDCKIILAHTGSASDHHTVGMSIATEATKRVIRENKIEILENKREIECKYDNCPLKSGIITPLRDKENVIGTLKIYYCTEKNIGSRDITLVKGLSELISTQFEISKVEKIKEMANKSEIKALQAQINPHFLFNALNTIVSFMRFDVDKARELIIDLSTYLRYSFEKEEIFVSLSKELQQVRAYVKIEQARFKDKINIIYDIQAQPEIKIPSLTIQPLIENAIKHGILKKEGEGVIKVSIKEKEQNKIFITIKDSGVGIETSIVENLYQGKSKEGSVGLLNVHNRLKLIYGKGLEVNRLENGTLISFEIDETY